MKCNECGGDFLHKQNCPRRDVDLNIIGSKLNCFMVVKNWREFVAIYSQQFESMEKLERDIEEYGLLSDNGNLILGQWEDGKYIKYYKEFWNRYDVVFSEDIMKERLEKEE